MAVENGRVSVWERCEFVPNSIHGCRPQSSSSSKMSSKISSSCTHQKHSSSSSCSDDERRRHRGKKRKKPCWYFLGDACTRGEHSCNFLHAHSTNPTMALLTHINAHQQSVRAMALPANTNTLYTGGQDETIKIWDCATGHCSKVIPMGKDVGCLLTQSSWLFVGLPNEVKVWNVENGSEQCLTGPKGQVHALAVYKDMLIAGSEDGSILVWRFTPSANTFQPLASLMPAHTGAVVTLEVAGDRLYSGSIDRSIKVWDLNAGHHIQTLEGHTDVVMSLLSWHQYLLSCSLDGTLKVWGVAESGALEVKYTYIPEDVRPDQVPNGALSLCGFIDSQGNSILLCSYNDNTIHMFELPSFAERGILFSREEVRTMYVGPECSVFSGDSTGEVKVWKWASPAATAIASP